MKKSGSDEPCEPSENDELRRKSRRSFIFGGLSAAVGFAGWHWLHGNEPMDGISWPIRRVLEFNRHVWSAVFDPHRQAKTILPPPVGKEPRLNGDLGLEDPIDLETWRLQVFHEDESGRRSFEKKFSLTELKLLPRMDTATDLHCIEGWSEPISYGGIRFADFLKETSLGKQGDGSYYPYVGLMTPDGGYYVSIDMPSMLQPQTLLAYEMNGRPLSNRHGAPLRLIIPVKYGIKSIKRIGKIWFSRRRPPDYWAERGYDWYAGL